MDELDDLSDSGELDLDSDDADGEGAIAKLHEARKTVGALKTKLSSERAASAALRREKKDSAIKLRVVQVEAKLDRAAALAQLRAQATAMGRGGDGEYADGGDDGIGGDYEGEGYEGEAYEYDGVEGGAEGELEPHDVQQLQEELALARRQVSARRTAPSRAPSRSLFSVARPLPPRPVPLPPGASPTRRLSHRAPSLPRQLSSLACERNELFQSNRKLQTDLHSARNSLRASRASSARAVPFPMRAAAAAASAAEVGAAAEEEAGAEVEGGEEVADGGGGGGGSDAQLMRAYRGWNAADCMGSLNLGSVVVAMCIWADDDNEGGGGGGGGG
eukprot:3975681-Prymnesium_polylepis.1